MEKNYHPKNIEEVLYQQWEQRGYFDSSDDKQPSWSLMIPPPNVTGSLHMGHAFQHTIMDFLTRWQRMQGKNTLWLPGTDHAGIATQMVVERQLNAKGETKEELGRDKFIEKIWQWKEQSGGSISKQLRRMGASVDWQRECFTMDEKLSKAVTEVYVKLYEQGLIYRGKRLVNWDPKFLTAISDLEVINQEEEGQLFYVRYPLVDGEVNGQSHMVIATTRPETILADGALAVNPNDEHYRPFVGKQVHVPLTTRVIPIITDDYVDGSFGSGCVKITPAHDFNDYDVGQRHTMEVINLFTPDAHMNENAPVAYQGMDRFEAREQIVKNLTAANLIEKIEKHLYKRPYGDRSGVVIEPLLTDQWYVKTQSLAQRAIEVVKEGQIQFTPKNWENTYFQWLENIQDWCISRQLWWGHRIPAWYTDDQQIIVAHNVEEAKVKAAELGYHGELTQDLDVLDTWFSSALWPFSTLGWPDDTKALKTFYPTSVMVSGFDIIFFWIARMIMFGLHFTDQIPFKQVYIHGLVRDKNGDKMSKSKGNVLDPIDIIDGISLDELLEKRTSGLMQPHMLKRIQADTRRDFPQGIASYGCDALRFTFLAMASTGRDIRFDLSRCEGYRNFCNKLWNAAKFTLMHLDKPSDPQTDEQDDNQSTVDLANSVSIEESQEINRWIVSRLQQVIQQVDRHIQTYRFDLVSATIYEFVWHDFCDWYLELIKPTLYKSANAQKAQTIDTLVFVLDHICRLTHPLIPFISETIWLQLTKQTIEENSLSVQAWPIADKQLVDTELEQQIDWMKNLISSVRQLRSQANIAPKQSITLALSGIQSSDEVNLTKYKQSIEKLIKVKTINIVKDTDEMAQGVSNVLNHMTVTIPFIGNIDTEKEAQRLDDELKKLAKQILPLQNKLNSDNFVNKAPAEVVSTAKNKLQQLETQQQKLQNLRQQL